MDWHRRNLLDVYIEIDFVLYRDRIELKWLSDHRNQKVGERTNRKVDLQNGRLAF
jgi:hypothetical protein